MCGHGSTTRWGSSPCGIRASRVRRSRALERSAMVQRGARAGASGGDVPAARRRLCSQPGERTMMNWLDYREALLGRIGDLGKLSPDTLAGYQTLSQAGRKTGHIDAKTRELIALAVAGTTRCDGCITVHTGEALKHGATR